MLNSAVKVSQVLITKDNSLWNWELISTILQVSLQLTNGGTDYWTITLDLALFDKQTNGQDLKRTTRTAD